MEIIWTEYGAVNGTNAEVIWIDEGAIYIDDTSTPPTVINAVRRRVILIT